MSKGASSLLSKHPLITSVTPQRRVTRTLTSVTNDEGEGDDVGVADEERFEEEQRLEEEEEMEKWTRGRRSLAFGEFSFLKMFNESLFSFNGLLQCSNCFKIRL